MTGWLIPAVLLPFVPLAWAWYLLQRALPRAERGDFDEFRRIARVEAERDHADVMRGLRGPVGEFARSCLAAESAMERVDLLCERLAAVDQETRQVTGLFSMLTRATLLLGGLGGVLALIALINQFSLSGAPEGWGVGCLALLLSGMAAFWCHWIGRTVSSGIEQRRRNWDQLCRMLEVPHMSGPNVEEQPTEARQQALRRENEGAIALDERR